MLVFVPAVQEPRKAERSFRVEQPRAGKGEVGPSASSGNSKGQHPVPHGSAGRSSGSAKSHSPAPTVQAGFRMLRQKALPQPPDSQPELSFSALMARSHSVSSAMERLFRFEEPI